MSGGIDTTSGSASESFDFELKVMDFESDGARTREIEFVPKSERTSGMFELKLEGPDVDESEGERYEVLGTAGE